MSRAVRLPPGGAGGWRTTPGRRRTEALRGLFARRPGLVLVLSATALLLLVWLPACLRTGMVDLRVYRAAAPHLATGDLYAFRLRLPGPHMFPLPFTYPPFAALLFLPLGRVAWPVVSGVWTAASVGALCALVHCCLRLADPAAPAVRHRRRVLLWSAALLWTEPVAVTCAFGQVNLLLAALVGYAVRRRAAATAGLGVGLAAGVKLVPAVTGLYFLAYRRWSAAGWAAAVFLATVAAGWWVAPRPAAEFWLHAVGEAARVGPVGSVLNQSLRGALSRTLGHDVGWSAAWWAVAVPAALAALAAVVRTVRRDDRLGALLAVQFAGLLLCPVSWCHHWVWAVAAVLWLVHTPRRTPPQTAALLAWCTALAGYPIHWLELAQPDIAQFGRPWYLAALGWCYPVCAVLTLVALCARTGGYEGRRMPLTAWSRTGRYRFHWASGAER
ncbi:glycosyltransferase 87 family protein [Streptomyces sp. NBC_01456]|uniref:glycosyltransferase 87 family protein n=1 Tax=unclassified Streptomyces TaxID=2593676 RepID=UPI002E2EA91A|nr:MULTISPECIES: glycosyltransferase 87 family protein [unclassified Streptomyces]